MNTFRIRSARRWEIAAYVVQLVTAIGAFAAWVRPVQVVVYGHALPVALQLSNALLSAVVVLCAGYVMVQHATEIRQPHSFHTGVCALTLGLAGGVAWKAGNHGDLLWLYGLFLASVLICCVTAIRYGEAELPTDPRGLWEPITDREFFRIWRDLTRGGVDLVLLLDEDPRMTVWTLPADDSLFAPADAVPFLALLGPDDAPVGYARFTVTPLDEAVAR